MKFTTCERDESLALSKPMTCISLRSVSVYKSLSLILILIKRNEVLYFSNVSDTHDSNWVCLCPTVS